MKREELDKELMMGVAIYMSKLKDIETMSDEEKALVGRDRYNMLLIEKKLKQLGIRSGSVENDMSVSRVDASKRRM